LLLHKAYKEAYKCLNHSHHHSKSGTSSSHGSSSIHCGDLQAFILTLQAQVANLQAAIPAAPAAGAAAVVTFADTPKILNTNDLLDYSTKSGSSIYAQGCKALDDKALAGGFWMTNDQTVAFVKAVSCRATAMGWNKGAKQITTFANRGGTPTDLIKCYRQIKEAILKIACERFCKAGEVDAKRCARQNNTMMAICLASSLTAEAQVRMLTYCNEYTFAGVEYAPLLYKIIMRLATIDSVATTQTLQENLQNLGVFGVTVNGDISKIHGGSTGIICNCWHAAPLLKILLGSCLMSTVLSPATISRSTSATTMMIGLMGSSLE
jgi:hypothetical protein